MPCPDHADKRTRARAMRRAGASRAEIARTLGMRDNGTLSWWLRGFDAPPGERTRWGYHDQVRARAIGLRKEGRPYREIMETLGVPKSTLSNWLKGIALTEEQRAALQQPNLDAVRRRAEARRARRIVEEERIRAEARAVIGTLSERERLIAGVVAYWAEGEKSKPWRTGQRVGFINSDPTMIRLFLGWIRGLGYSEEDLIFRVSIHEDADIKGAEGFWSRFVGVPAHRFKRSTLKRHKPATNRRNRGEGYVGCLTIVVRRSTELYRHIAGRYDGIVAGIGP